MSENSVMVYGALYAISDMTAAHDVLDREITRLRLALAAAEREVERLKAETCRGCQVNIAKQREAEDATMAANRRVVAAERARDEAVEAMKDVLALANTRGSVMEMLVALVRIEARARAVLEGGK